QNTPLNLTLSVTRVCDSHHRVTAHVACCLCLHANSSTITFAQYVIAATAAPSRFWQITQDLSVRFGPEHPSEMIWEMAMKEKVRRPVRFTPDSPADGGRGQLIN